MTDSHREESKLERDLTGVAESDYNGNYFDHCLEQYKVYVESAERISDRRQSANSFFLSANTLLVGAEGALFELWESFGPVGILLGFAGVILSYTWYRVILSYKGMNSGKFAVIHEIEKRLPFRLYFAEWELLEHGLKSGNYIKFTVIERGVPRLFMVIHIIVIAIASAVLAGCIP